MSKLVKCPTCGGLISTTAERCPHCGEARFICETSTRKVCPTCNGTASEGSRLMGFRFGEKHCKTCGFDGEVMAHRKEDRRTGETREFIIRIRHPEDSDF